MIEEGFSVTEAVRYLKISRSTYYYKPKKYKRKKNDESILKRIQEIKQEHPYWGYRRICAMLRKQGEKINHKRVYRIMKENRLLLKQYKMKAKRSFQRKIIPNKPRQVLGIDMTKVLTKDGGWVNYIAVIDWYTREVLGSQISLRGRTEEWLKALNNALNKGYKDGVRGREVILVSDNGTQPTSRRFMEECKILGIKQIFTSYNNPKGNANTERYFRTYKEEVVWPVEEMSYSELVARTKEYEEFYNSKYPHSALKYRSPREVYEEYLSFTKVS
ncbi:integrase, catalytic region [Thermosipho africanus TCF52B]|uniref:Integrase, catalytic region n=1 Tax=Thermosipho africanus (strain TCF52B) TaxID=484019 RepID=B7IGX8_THEAB|nr:integrase, catalytic region [Thermosipho africanus TCF52B]